MEDLQKTDNKTSGLSFAIAENLDELNKALPESSRGLCLQSMQEFKNSRQLALMPMHRNQTAIAVLAGLRLSILITRKDPKVAIAGSQIPVLTIIDTLMAWLTNPEF